MPIQIETHAGEPVRAGQTRLIPFVQTARLTFPGAGGFAWHRPTAVVAHTPDGRELVLPVPDVTRQAQVALLGLGVLGAFLIWFFNRK